MVLDSGYNKEDLIKYMGHIDTSEHINIKEYMKTSKYDRIDGGKIPNTLLSYIRVLAYKHKVSVEQLIATCL